MEDQIFKGNNISDEQEYKEEELDLTSVNVKHDYRSP